MSEPAISVVVPSHDRPLRLRWLLNALEEQTLDPARWEVVVVHDSGSDTDRLLREHPLSASGALMHRRVEPTSAACKRNVGWRLARAPLIAFTDDDCRPPEEWLARALAAAERHPGAIVQGATEVDPDEWPELHGPHPLRQEIDPPTVAAETCNIIYPTALLKAVGGFAEDTLCCGEDTDLAIRIRQATGAEHVGAPEVLTYHAVESGWLLRRLLSLSRWQDLAWLIRRHPELRKSYHLRIFWKRSHMWLAFALPAALLAPRRRAWLALLIPWAVDRWPSYGSGWRARLRGVTELPGLLVFDAAELVTLARGSVKHRSMIL